MSLEGVFEKIDLLSGIKKQNAVKLMVSDACLLALHMFDSAVQQHAALTDATAMSRHNGALKNQLISALNITTTCADLIMKRYGDDDQLACLVEIPANCALKMQSRQRYVTLVLEANTSRTLLEWIGRLNPAYVEEYKKKQNRSMAAGTIFLMILGAIFLALGLTMEGMFASWFCMPMAIFCFIYGIFRIIIQLANKQLNG